MTQGNQRFGQDHHNAVLTSVEVELIRTMYEDGFHSYKALAEKFDVSKSTIRDVVKYRRRAYG